MIWRRILAAAVFLALVALYFTTESYHTVVQGTPDSKSWLAASTLLEKQHISSRQIHGAAQLFPLPDANTLVIIDRHRSELSKTQIDALHDWVAEGGRLVIAARPLYYHDDEDEDACVKDCKRGDDNKSTDQTDDQGPVNYAEQEASQQDLRDNDPLLYSFGVSAWDVPRRDVWPPLPGFASESELQQKLSVPLLGKCLHPNGEDGDFCSNLLCGDVTHTPIYSAGMFSGALRRFAFNPELKLMHIDQFPDDSKDERADAEEDPIVPHTDTRLEAEAGNRYGAQLMRLRYHKGDLIVVTGLGIWSNTNLAYLDHAWLLDTVASGANQVWWVHSVDMPPLAAWLWPRSWPLLISLAVLLLLFLWLKMPRRGVLLTQPGGHPRDFIDHLHASGFFLWRTGQHQALLEPLRNQVRRKLSRHHSDAEPALQVQHAAALTGIAAEQIQMALTGTPNTDHDMTFIIDILQTLRSRL